MSGTDQTTRFMSLPRRSTQHSRRSGSGTNLQDMFAPFKRRSVEPPRQVLSRANILETQLRTVITERGKLQAQVDRLERELALLQREALRHSQQSEDEFVSAQLSRLEADTRPAHVRVSEHRQRSSTVSVRGSLTPKQADAVVDNARDPRLVRDSGAGSPRPVSVSTIGLTSPRVSSAGDDNESRPPSSPRPQTIGVVSASGQSASPASDAGIADAAGDPSPPKATTLSRSSAAAKRGRHRRNPSRVQTLKAAFEPLTPADGTTTTTTTTTTPTAGGYGAAQGGALSDTQRRALFDYYTPYLELKQQLRRLEGASTSLAASYAQVEEKAQSHADAMRRAETTEDSLLRDIFDLREELDAIHAETNLLRETAAQREAEVGLEVSTLTDEFNADLSRMHALEDQLQRGRAATSGASVASSQTSRPVAQSTAY